MPIPDFQTLMLPLLKLTVDGTEHRLRDTIEQLAKTFNLSEDEKSQLLRSGNQSIFDNRVGWAKTYLLKAGLLEATRRSYFKITDRGRQLLQTKPAQINLALLKQYPEYLEFAKTNKAEESTENIVANQSSRTPEEVMESAYQQIRTALVQELLAKIKQITPASFERLVVKLLVNMGYGGSVEDAGQTTRLSSDGGIDGIIKEDKLGLDVIYLQAKRWGNQAVGRPDIQSFVGALDGQRASKGVFITTSRFVDNAKEYVKTISKKVILIDGEQLAGYLIDYGLGVSVTSSFVLKKVDNDYFED